MKSFFYTLALVTALAALCPAQLITSVASQCATSNDGTVVGTPNPLNPPQVSAVYTGTLPAGNYYVVESWYDALSNTTLVGPEVQIQLTGTGEIQEMPPTSGLPNTVSGRNIYISTASGTETLQGSAPVAATYVQSIPLVTGAAVPAVNSTVCQVIANDSGWPTGTGYSVDFTTTAGDTLPGYPMQWQLLGPGNTINLSSGLPLYNGTVTYPSPILAIPYNHGTQSISGPLSLGNYSFTAGSVTAPQVNGIQYISPLYPRGGTDVGSEVNLATAACPACQVFIEPSSSCYNWTTPINLTNIISFQGAGAFPSCLNWTGSSSIAGALTVNSIIAGGGFNGSISNLTLCYQGCSPNIYTANTATAIILGSTASYVSQEVVDRVGFFGWNKAVSLNNSTFDDTFINDSFFNGQIGVYTNTIATPIHIRESNFTAMATAAVQCDGAGAIFDITGGDIEPPGSGSGECGIKVTANCLVTATMVHFENPSGPAGFGDQFVCGTAGNAHFVMLGGDMQEDDLNSGHTNPQFVTWNGDQIDMTDVNVTSNGATVTGVVRGSNAASTLNLEYRNGQPSLIPAAIVGTLPSSYNTKVCNANGMGCTVSQKGYSFGLADRGQCIMTAGTCGAQSLSGPYVNAPNCFLTWTGTGTLAGVLQVTSTASPSATVTPHSSNGGDTATVNWACFGN